MSPRGAYTTARTFGRHSVFEFDTHVQRTADSARLMMLDDLEKHAASSSSSSSSSTTTAPPQPPPAPSDLPEITDPARLRDLMRKSIGAAVSAFESGTTAAAAASATQQQQQQQQREHKITVLVCWGKSAAELQATVMPLLSRTHGRQDSTSPPFLVMTHVTPLPPRRAPPIKVVVRGAPRHNAKAKDSEWVRQRISLEASKPADVEELLLMDESDGSVLEGTQTNVFAVVGGGSSASVVVTAEEGVLAGTVRRLVLEVCEKEGVPVLLQAPNVEGLREQGAAARSSSSSSSAGGGGGGGGQEGGRVWEAAFLTSTSRLVLPIDEVAWPSDDKHSESRADRVMVLNSRHHPLVQKLERLVEEQVAGHSSRVVE